MYKDNVETFFVNVELIARASEYSLTKADVRDKLTRLINDSIESIRNTLTHPKYLNRMWQDNFFGQPEFMRYKQLARYAGPTHEESKLINIVFAKYYLSNRNCENFDLCISKVENTLGLSKEDLAEAHIL